MPTRLVFHERYAFALDRTCHDHVGLLAAGSLAGIQHIEQGLHVVAIYFDDIPTECLELGRQIPGLHDIVDVAIDLQVIAVNDGNQVAELLMDSEHGCLPNLAFLAFAVTEHAEHTRVVFGEAQAGSQAGSDR